MPALDVIAQYGRHRDVLLYVDPPYLGSTRPRSTDGYRFEMKTAAEHEELLVALRGCEAAVVLSGYRSDLYDELLEGWWTVDIAASTGQGPTWSERVDTLEQPRHPRRPAGPRVPRVDAGGVGQKPNVLTIGASSAPADCNKLGNYSQGWV